LLYCKQPACADTTKIPPRHRDRPLLARHVMLWMVLPWSIIWCTMWTTLSVMGLWMHVGFFRSKAIVGTTQHRGVELGAVACEFASSPDRKSPEKMARDPEPFHCSCPVRFFPFSSAVVLEQWGREIVEEAASCREDSQACISAKRSKRALAHLGMTVGRYQTSLYTVDGGSDKRVLDMLEACVGAHPVIDKGQEDHRRSKHEWCWRDRTLSLKQKPLLDHDTNCGALGSNAAHTMSFVGTIIAKLLLVLSVSNEGPLLQCLHKSVPLSVSVLVCLALTFVVVYLPALLSFRLPGTQSLPLGPLVTTISIALVAHVLLDIVKIFYRAEIKEDVALKKYHAKMIREGVLTGHSSDAEVRAMLHEDFMKGAVSRTSMRASSA